MKVVNLSTLKLNDHHSYYGGAIGNIAYELLAALARRDGIEVYSTVEGTDFEGEPPDDLVLAEVDGRREHRELARDAAPLADVLMHGYFHEPEASPVLDIVSEADAPFVLGLVEAPHQRFADELHGLERIGPVRRLGRKWLMRDHRRTLRAAAKAIYVTDHARRHYREHVPGAQGPVVPYGVDTDRFTPGNGHGSEPRVLVVSRLIRRRGIQHLIDALPEITLRAPDVEVDIVGTGDYEQVLRNKLAEQIHITNKPRESSRVTFYGNVEADQLLELYRDATVFVHLSCDDGWNQPALEAMASGTAVVATDRPHNPMVVDGVTGWLVDWAAPEQVADAVGELVAEPERAAEFGRAGRALAESHYSSPLIARYYERALRCVMTK